MDGIYWLYNILTISALLSLALFINNGTATDDVEPYDIDILDNGIELERLLYGDITSTKDMFLPSLDSQSSESDIDEEESQEKVKEPTPWNFDYLHPNEMTSEIIEFNDITKTLNNATRKWRGQWQGYNDPEDPGTWWFWKISTEPEKISKMINMNLQWLIHTRFQVKKALEQKHEIRMDKRYRIGYLVSRLKIIKYEQQKIATYAQEQDKSYYRALTSLIKLYEKMVRYDVDIKDTVNLIRKFDNEPEPKKKGYVMPENPRYG